MKRWSPAQDEILRQSLADGKTFRQAAALAGASRNAAIGRANRLGFVRAEGGDAAGWSEAEDNAVMRAGHPAAIGREIGRTCGAVIARRKVLLAEGRTYGSKAKLRKCLRCGAEIVSQHAGHRMCDQCRRVGSAAGDYACHA